MLLQNQINDALSGGVAVLRSGFPWQDGDSAQCFGRIRQDGGIKSYWLAVDKKNRPVIPGIDEWLQMAEQILNAVSPKRGEFFLAEFGFSIYPRVTITPGGDDDLLFKCWSR